MSLFAVRVARAAKTNCFAPAVAVRSFSSASSSAAAAAASAAAAEAKKASGSFSESAQRKLEERMKGLEGVEKVAVKTSLADSKMHATTEFGGKAEGYGDVMAQLRLGNFGHMEQTVGESSTWGGGGFIPLDATEEDEYEEEEWEYEDAEEDEEVEEEVDAAPAK